MNFFLDENFGDPNPVKIWTPFGHLLDTFWHFGTHFAHPEVDVGATQCAPNGKINQSSKTANAAEKIDIQRKNSEPRPSNALDLNVLASKGCTLFKQWTSLANSWTDIFLWYNNN